MTTVYQWKIYCITEGEYVTGFGSEEPTECYHNAADLVNPNSVQRLTQYSANAVVIQEETLPTGKHCICKNYTFHVPASTANTTFDLVFSYPITLLEAKIRAAEENIGDTVSLMVMPRMHLEAVLLPITDEPVHSISVTPEARAMLFVGLNIGVTVEDNYMPLGCISNIDDGAQRLTFEMPLPEVLPPTAMFSTTEYLIYKQEIVDRGVETVAFGLSEGFSVASGTVLRFRYENGGDSDVTARFGLKYFY